MKSTLYRLVKTYRESTPRNPPKDLERRHRQVLRKSESDKKLWASALYIDI